MNIYLTCGFITLSQSLTLKVLTDSSEALPNLIRIIIILSLEGIAGEGLSLILQKSLVDNQKVCYCIINKKFVCKKEDPNMHEKIKRKCSFIAAMILTAVLFTGCAVQTNITFQENGSGRYEETISFAESTWEQIFSEDESDILNYYRTLYPQAEVFVSNETIRGTASKCFDFG
ncbi:hypothetical protein C823_007998 [Eubacterium plexicaudatum ASF492]|nr:hypothetical protein C823_007998 [Eubacterium plexicaudatum ASF492]